MRTAETCSPPSVVIEDEAILERYPGVFAITVQRTLQGEIQRLWKESWRAWVGLPTAGPSIAPPRIAAAGVEVPRR